MSDTAAIALLTKQITTPVWKDQAWAAAHSFGLVIIKGGTWILKGSGWLLKGGFVILLELLV